MRLSFGVEQRKLIADYRWRIINKKAKPACKPLLIEWFYLFIRENIWRI
jgi:hypothetical protein